MDGYFAGSADNFSTRMENCCEDKYSMPFTGEDTRHDEFGGDPSTGADTPESMYEIRSQTTADQPTSNKYIPRKSQQDVKSLATPASPDRQTIQDPVSEQPDSPAMQRLYN
jgi:hypothetical protein